MNTQKVTAIRVAIGGAADLQALIRETPASLTLQTPSASVQIRVLHAQFDDSCSLPAVCHGTYGHS